MNIVVEDDIEERSRRTVANTKGFRIGNISIVFQEGYRIVDKTSSKIVIPSN